MGALEDLPGNAPEEEPFEAGLATRSHHDQVRTERLGGSDDLGAGIADRRDAIGH